MASTVLGIVGGVIGFYFGGPAGAQVGFALGSAVGSTLEPPTKLQGPSLGKAPVQTGRDGVPFPVGWGVVYTAGNIIQLNPIIEVETEERSGKGGGGTVVVHVRRYRTFAIGVCRSNVGEILGIQRIWENDKLVYDTREFPAIDEDETAKFAEGIRIYLGRETQLPDPDLEAHTGIGKCPAYRGVPYVVFIDKDITEFGSAIPQYSFEVLTDGQEPQTSHPYPIEAIDELGVWCRLAYSDFPVIPNDSHNLEMTFPDVELKWLLFTTGPHEDHHDIDFTFPEIELLLKLLETGPHADYHNIEFTFPDIELDRILVKTTMNPNDLQLACEFEDGSMTAT